MAVVFIPQTLLSAAPALRPSPETPPVLNLQIPNNLGTIEKVFVPKIQNPNPAFVIHIQDAHGYPEAQKNIEKILQHLAREKKMESIALEAAFGPLDPSLLKITESPEINQAIADRLARSGELTGAELFALQPESKGMTFLGAENADLYFQSYEIFKSLKSKKEVFETKFSGYRHLLDEIESRRLNPALRSFLQKKRIWEDGRDESFDYFQLAAELSKNLLKIDFTDSSKQFEWPHFTRLATIRSMETHLKREVAARQLSDLKDLIKKKLKPSPDKEFLLKGIESFEKNAGNAGFVKWILEQTLKPEIKTPREFFEVFSYLAKNAEIPLLQFPQFLSWAGISLLQQELDARALMKELEILEPKIEKRLLKSRHEKAIVEFDQDLSLLKKLLSLELTRADFEKYQIRKGKLAAKAFAQRWTILTRKSGPEIFSEEDLHQAEKFYEFSRLRDEKLLEPVLKQIASGKSTALVTGGFHAEGISELLEKKNISYVTLTPKITSPQAENFYEQIMLGKGFSKDGFDTNQNLGAAVLAQKFPSTDSRFDSIRDRRQTVIRRAAQEILEEESWSQAEIEVLPIFRDPKQDVVHKVDRGVLEKMNAEILESLFGFTQLGGIVSRQILSKRSEVRTKDWDIDAQSFFEKLPAGDFKNRLAAAIHHLETLKMAQEKNLTQKYAKSLPQTGPPRMIPVIEELMRRIYDEFRVGELPLAYRTVFVLAGFDSKKFSGDPDIHGLLLKMIREINLISYTTQSRLEAADYQKFMKFVDQEHLQTIDHNILIQTAVNRFLIDLPRVERRALEKEALLREFWKELREKGKGDIPQIVFLTDLHGGIKVGDLIAFSLGVKNYRSIRDVADLEKRMREEKISIEDKNIMFVGGSDYVDRGPKPYRAFTFIRWLRANGKLKFINGNHDLWKDWNMFGVHLRVNDTLRQIRDDSKLSQNDREKYARIVQEEFVSTFGKTEEEIQKITLEARNLMDRFFIHIKNGTASEEVIQQFSDEIIDSGANPNHSLEWWAREWYDHAGWADMFLDEINENLLNEAIEAIHSRLFQDPQKVDKIKKILLNQKDLPPILKLHRDQLLAQLELGRLFSRVDSASFYEYPEVKKAKENIEKLKKENIEIRTFNEKVISEGGFSKIKHQHKVPTTFPETAHIARSLYQTMREQAEALQKLLSEEKLLVPEVELVNPENYRQNKFVAESALWNMKNFRLVFVDIYGNAYLHGIIPIDQKSTSFKVEYKGLKGVEAIEYMQYDIRRFFEGFNEIQDTPEFRKKMHKKLGPAFRILDEWYSDVTAYLKPPQMKTFLKNGGPSVYSYATSSAYSPRYFNPQQGVIHLGHLDLDKMAKAKLPYWSHGMEGGIINADHDLSEGYQGLGAVFSHFMRMPDGTLTGMRRFGYEVTSVSLAKKIKDKNQKLKGKNESEIQKTEKEILLLQEQLKKHEEEKTRNGGETIKDISLHELPLEEQKKIEPFLEWDRISAYYMDRFAKELITSYEELIQDTKNRGRLGRVSYYEDKLVILKREIEQESHKRSEVRIEDLPETLQKEAGEKLGLDLSKLSSAELATLHAHSPFFLEVINNYGFWLESRNEKILEVIRRPGILTSSDTFVPALTASGIFDPIFEEKQEGVKIPDENRNSTSMKMLWTLSKNMPLHFTLAQKSLYSAMSAIFKVDRSNGVTMHGIDALAYGGEDGIAMLLSFLSPVVGPEYRRRAFFSILSVKEQARNFLIKALLDAPNDRIKKYYASVLDEVFKDGFDSVGSFIQEKGQVEQIRELLGEYTPSVSEWTTSKLFYSSKETDHSLKVNAQIKKLKELRDKLTEEKYQRLLNNWGIAVTLNWANQKFETVQEVLTFLADLPQVNDLNRALVEAVDGAQTNERASFLWNLLIALTNGGVFNQEGVSALIDKVVKDPARSPDLIAFLTVIFRLGNFNFEEDKFIQKKISELLHSPMGPVYYMIRNLASSIPHATTTGKGLEREIRTPILKADEMYRLKPGGIHYMRMTLHREASSDDYLMVEGILSRMMDLHAPNSEKKLNPNKLPDLLGNLIRDDKQAEVFSWLVSPEASQIAEILFKELQKMGAPSGSRAGFFIDNVPEWKGYSEEETQSKAFKAAVNLIQVLRATNERYVGMQPNKEKVKAAISTQGYSGAIQEANAERLKVKKQLLTQSSINAYSYMHMKRHQFNEEGFVGFGFYGEYQEEYFDAFESDRVRKREAEIMHEEYLGKSGKFQNQKENIKKWIHEELVNPDRQEQAFSDTARQDLLEMIENMAGLIEMMEIDGIASEHLAIYAKTLRNGGIDLNQIRTILLLIQDEINRIYDFFITKYGGYPEIIAASLGKTGINPVYRREDDESLSEEAWTQRVQEMVMAELYAQEKSVTLLKDYSEGLQELFDWGNGIQSEKAPTHLFLWKDEILKPQSADIHAGIITRDNFSESTSSSALYIGFKAFENFRLLEKGYPVPPFVVLPANLPQRNEEGEVEREDPELRRWVIHAILELEKSSGEVFPFGDMTELSPNESEQVSSFRNSYAFNPIAPMLQFSVRSGSFVSMPGMLDTVLNMPFNKEILEQFTSAADHDIDEIKFHLDNYRRFLTSYGIAHLRIQQREFAQLVDQVKEDIARRKQTTTKYIGLSDFTVDDMNRMVQMHYEHLIAKKTKAPEDDDPVQQVIDVVADIYNSWKSLGARNYRKKFGIADSFNTSVTLQKMVFGNRNSISGTGVILTSDSSMGVRDPSGSFKIRAQGTDLVGGVAGHSLAITRREGGDESLEAKYPAIFNKVAGYINRLDREEGPSDVELTVDNGVPYILQSRAVPMAGNGQKTYLDVKEPNRFKSKTKGTPSSPNAAVGRILDIHNINPQSLLRQVKRLRLDMDDAGEQRYGIILVADYVDDNIGAALVQIHNELGTNSVRGMINSKIGKGNHGGLVARKLGIAYVSDVDIQFDDTSKSMRIDKFDIPHTGMLGPIISIDGYSPFQSETSGLVFLEEVPFYVEGEKKEEEEAQIPKVDSSDVFSGPYNYDLPQQPVLTNEPVKLALNLGGYRIDAKGQTTTALMSNYDRSPQVVANKVSNRVLNAYLREIIGDPNISLTDIYGVEDIERFHSSLVGNIFHGRYPAESLSLKREEAQTSLLINGHAIRLHSDIPSPEELRERQTEYFVDFSDPELTRESSANREERLKTLQTQSGIKKMFLFSPDDDPAKHVLAAGVNEEIFLKPGEALIPLASPMTSGIALVLKVMEDSFPGEFENYSAILASRPVTGDPGNINFSKGPFGTGLRALFLPLSPETEQTPVALLEYAIPKGAGNVEIFLNPEKGSLFDITGLKKEDKDLKIKELRELVIQKFKFAASGVLNPYMRVAGKEDLSSLLGIRDRHQVVIDSQDLSENGVLENGQVKVYFHVNDYGYAALLNQIMHRALLEDKEKISASARDQFIEDVNQGKWREGTIPPNPQKKTERFVKSGDEIGFAIVGVRGRIGKQLVQILTENPNYRPIVFVGIQDVDTVLAQYREDLVQGPILVTRVGEDGIQKSYHFVKSKDPLEPSSLRLYSEEFGEFLMDSRTHQPLSIPYYHLEKHTGETNDGFERRMKDTIGEKRLSEIETLFNATGAFLSSSDPFYHAFSNGNASGETKLSRVIITSPPKRPEDVAITLVRGVNESSLVKMTAEALSKVIFCSGASCTTTALGRSLIEYVKFLEGSGLEVKNIRFVTHHAQTPSQGRNFGGSSAGKSLRTANDPSMSAAKEETGANRVLAEVVKDFKGRLSGNSQRDGNLGGSVLEITAFVESEKEKYPNAEEVNAHFEKLSKLPELKGIISYEPNIQSTAQIIGNENASLFMPEGTRIERGRTGASLTIRIGYDNEKGYSVAQKKFDELAAKAVRGIPTSPISASLEKRSELRVPLKVEKGYRELVTIMGSQRSWEQVRWVTLHMAHGILLPVPVTVLPEIMPFFEADLPGFFGVQKNFNFKNKEVGLHISVSQTLPQENDLIYAGMAQVLDEEPHRYISLAVLKGDAAEVVAANLAFDNQYPAFAGRFEINLLGRSFEQSIQRMIDQVMREVQKEGVFSGIPQEFYDHVSFSSADLEILNRVLAPVRWRIQDDLAKTPAIQAHLMRTSLKASQNHLEAERLRKLMEIKSRVISAASEFLVGEDLAAVEALFDQIIAVQQLYISA